MSGGRAGGQAAGGCQAPQHSQQQPIKLRTGHRIFRMLATKSGDTSSTCQAEQGLGMNGRLGTAGQGWAQQQKAGGRDTRNCLQHGSPRPPATRCPRKSIWMAFLAVLARATGLTAQRRRRERHTARHTGTPTAGALGSAPSDLQQQQRQQPGLKGMPAPQASMQGRAPPRSPPSGGKPPPCPASNRGADDTAYTRFTPIRNLGGRGSPQRPSGVHLRHTCCRQSEPNGSSACKQTRQL